MANAIVAKIATAMMISSKVNPRRRLTGAINIKFDPLGLFRAAALPLRRQRDPIHTGKLDSIVLLQFSWSAFLDQLHRAVAGVDVEFFRRIRSSGGRLHLGHPVR